MNAVILLATLNRPEWLLRILTSWQETAPQLEMRVATDPDDLRAREIVQGYPHAYTTICQELRRGPAYAWNTALKAADTFCRSTGAYIIVGDDCVFKPGWWEATLAGLAHLGGSGLVGFNDGRKDGNRFTSTHYLMTRDFIVKYHGGVAAVPHYRTINVDMEATRRAQRAGMYYWAKDAHVVHDWHGRPNDNKFDQTYEAARPFWKADAALAKERERAGWPDDFPPVIGWQPPP